MKKGLLLTLFLMLLSGRFGYAQDSLAVDYAMPDDSLSRRIDSLEVSMLEETQTYAQIERIINLIPRQAVYLNQIPSVLPVALPIDAFRITSPFGIRKHPIHKQIKFHGGVDVKAPVGMPVTATASGVVSRVGYDVNLGVFVQLRHAYGFETTYGHLAGYCVKVGQLISRSEEIGRVGRTGAVTGPHLHYVIKKNGSVIDPFQFCFLLRRRLWLLQMAKPSGSAKDSTAALLSNDR